MPAGQAAQWRIFNDLYAIYRPWSPLELMGLFDYGVQQRSSGSWQSWWGSSLQLRWHFSPEWRLAGRLEYFSDPGQVIVTTQTPQGFQMGGASLNLDWAFHPQALWRTEVRALNSRDAIYPGARKEQHLALDVVLVSSLSLRWGGER